MLLSGSVSIGRSFVYGTVPFRLELHISEHHNPHDCSVGYLLPGKLLKRIYKSLQGFACVLKWEITPIGTYFTKLSQGDRVRDTDFQQCEVE